MFKKKQNSSSLALDYSVGSLVTFSESNIFLYHGKGQSGFVINTIISKYLTFAANEMYFTCIILWLNLTLVYKEFMSM